MKTIDKIKQKKALTSSNVNQLERKHDFQQKTLISEPNPKSSLLIFGNVKLLSYSLKRRTWLYQFADLSDVVVKYSIPEKIELGLPLDDILYEKHKRIFEEYKESILLTIRKKQTEPPKVATVQKFNPEPTMDTDKLLNSKYEALKAQKNEITDYDYKKHKFWEAIFENHDEFIEAELVTHFKTKYKKTTTQTINIIFQAENEGYIINTNFPFNSNHIYKLNKEAICKCISQERLAA